MQGGRVRVAAQLTQASTGLHLWSDTIERDVRDAWAVQQQIARSIVAAIELEFTPLAQRISAAAHNPHPDAFELYLKARYASDSMQEASQRKAIERFQRAIAIDPFYSLPLVGLARSYLNLTALNVVPPSDVVPLANAALRRALELDPNLPEAHGLIANTIARHEWDWPRAEQHFVRALELAPHSAVVHHEFSMACLVPQGRFEQGLAENRRARELDPLTPGFVRAYIWLLIHSRQLGEAERECRRFIAESREPAYFRNQLGLVLFGQKRLQEAWAEFEAAGTDGPNPEVSQVNAAMVQALLGERAAAERLLEHLQAQAAVRYVPATSLAFLNGALGREEEALAALEQACRNREYSLVSAKVFFLFDPFRKHPRFQAVLHELHRA
jgi:tetratricopeptide (TPR) repeat protein